MAKFFYEATNGRGAMFQGNLEALDRSTVVLYLEKKNLIPVQIKEVGRSGTSAVSQILFEHITILDVIFFVRNLAAGLRAGLDIIETIDALLTDTRKKTMKKILLTARANLENGQPLSFTLRRFPTIFSPAAVGMIHAGETSGRLDHVLHELNDYLMRQYEISRRVRGALAYPVLLLAGSLGVIALLLLFVLPRLEHTFRQANVSLPITTRALLAVSKILSFNMALDLIGVLAIVAFIVVLKRTIFGKRLLFTIGFHIPVIHGLLQKVTLVRFTNILGNSLASGLPVTEALLLSRDVVGSEKYQKVISEAETKLKSGVPISQAFSEHKNLFPSFLIGLMRVGEKTGTLENVLKTFSDFYRDEMDHALKNLSTLLEPLLLLFMGLLIGFIALSLLLPIYQLVGKFV